MGVFCQVLAFTRLEDGDDWGFFLGRGWFHMRALYHNRKAPARSGCFTSQNDQPDRFYPGHHKFR